MFSQVIYCSSAQNSEESSAGACSFCGFHALRGLSDRMLAFTLALTLAFPKLLHCTVHYTEIHVNYNRTIQRGITLLHHKAVFTNPCYYATLATMPLSLGPKGWHSIEV